MSIESLGPLGMILVGLALLAAGRALFWLAVGCLGFGAGWTLASQLGPSEADSRLIVAVVAGVVGAVLAVLLQKVAIAVGGALLGGLLASRLIEGAEWPLLLGAVVVGAIAGALLASLLFSFALALVTSAAGALLIGDALPVAPTLQLVAVIGLTLLGLLIQLGRGRRKRPATEGSGS